MEKGATGAIVTVLIAITGVAILAALVSNAAQTGNVLTGGGNALSMMICTALSPITGKTCGACTKTCSAGYQLDLGTCTCTNVSSTIHF